MATKLYMAVLGVVFAGALLAGMYDRIPPWLVWLLGIGLAVGVLSVGLTIIGSRLLSRQGAPVDAEAGGDAETDAEPNARAKNKDPE